MNPKIIRLFQEMYELTEPECRLTCRCPQSCCSPEYCEMAAEFASENGIVLKRTEHPTLKFMSSKGCVVPPHLRPLCTLHTCDINGHGFKPNDPAWTKKYFDLRASIERALYNEGL